MRVIFFLRRELMKRVEVLDLAFQFVKWIDQRAQTRNFIDIGLGALAVVPKIGRRHPRFERGQFFLQFGQVKETSAVRGRATSNLQRQRWFLLAWGNNNAADWICQTSTFKRLFFDALDHILAVSLRHFKNVQRLRSDKNEQVESRDPRLSGNYQVV